MGRIYRIFTFRFLISSLTWTKVSQVADWLREKRLVIEEHNGIPQSSVLSSRLKPRTSGFAVQCAIHYTTKFYINMTCEKNWLINITVKLIFVFFIDSKSPYKFTSATARWKVWSTRVTGCKCVCKFCWKKHKFKSSINSTISG